MGKNLWVAPRNGQLTLHGKGNSKYGHLFDTQKQGHKFSQHSKKNKKAK